MNNLEIKEVTEKDYEFLYVLMNDDAVMKALNEVSTSISNWKEAILYWKEDKDEENYIAYIDNTPIGWIGINSLLSSDKEAFIKMLAVLPLHQKQGVGVSSVKYIVELLKDRGFSKVSLYTDKENVNAQQCYSKCNFEIEEKLMDKMSNGATVERYKMSLKL